MDVKERERRKRIEELNVKLESIWESIQQERQMREDFVEKIKQNESAIGSINAIRKQKESGKRRKVKEGKEWLCLGDFFIEMPTSSSLQLLEQNQNQLEKEKKLLDVSINTKTETLQSIEKEEQSLRQNV